MTLTPGLVAVALISVACAVAGVGLLLGPTGCRDVANRLWVTGGAVALLTLLCGAFGLVGVTGGGPVREALVSGVAVGVTLAGLLGGAGLLRSPGGAVTGAATVRLLLDGVVTAASLWVAGWVLLTEPTRLITTAPRTVGPAVLLATVTTALAAGLTAVVAARGGGRAQRRMVGACLALTTGMLGGLALAAGLAAPGTDLAAVGALGMGAAVLAGAFALRWASPLPSVPDDEMRRDSGYGFVPMTLVVAAALWHLARGGAFGLWAVLASAVEGFALVARQYLFIRDIAGYADRLARREAHFRELAHTDPLTGLANRRGLLRALHDREDGPASVLLSLDLDGFKNVNDMRGHDVGDAVLVTVAQRLWAALGPGDLAARLGGDEFAILLRFGAGAEPDLGTARALAERLLTALGEPYPQVEGPLFLSVSVGIATGTDVEVLLRHADLALRYAKQRGKNRVERYDVAYDTLLRRRTVVEHELRGAIERDELRLAFQPVVSVPSVRPVGAEALLRWQHPELGRVGPDEFIPLAEESGMIVRLGAWVLDRACQQLSGWLADGHDVWLSVNVSPRELHAPEYVTQVAEALRVHGVPPQRLVLEVTEQAVATDLDELIRRLAALRRTGVRVALDDFGAGYSSLGQLRRLPIDILKIDHSLVAEQGAIRSVGLDGRPYAPMVDVVMRLGHQLGLEVIAEGVTNPTELAAVVAAGCRFGQGQLFGWGVPAEHLEAMLEAASSPNAPIVPLPRPGDAAGELGDTASQDVRVVDSAREIRQA